MTKIVFMLLVALSLSACAGGATMYPINKQAQKMGVVKLTYTSTDVMYGLTGTVTGALASGEVLNGEYTSVDTNKYNFGNIYANTIGQGSGSFSVTGTEGHAYGTARATGSSSTTGSFSSMMKSGARPGIVSLYGDDGTMLDCEYLYNANGGGVGGCKANNGALFRMHIR